LGDEVDRPSVSFRKSTMLRSHQPRVRFVGPDRNEYICTTAAKFGKIKFADSTCVAPGSIESPNSSPVRVCPITLGQGARSSENAAAPLRIFSASGVSGRRTSARYRHSDNSTRVLPTL
jgi:hypothetical protein